jgi:EF-hand domain pair
VFGLEQLKVKLSSSDVALVFEHLDKNCDGYISYSEFCFLCEEKRRNIDPFDNKEPKRAHQTIVDDEVELLSRASHMYQGFKSRRLKSNNHFSKALQVKPRLSTHLTFGVTSLPSDNINQILTHQFEKDYNSKLQEKSDREREMIMATISKR